VKRRTEKSTLDDRRDSRATKRNLPVVARTKEPRAVTDTIPQARFARGEYSITMYKGGNDKLPEALPAKRTAAGSQPGLRRPTTEAPAILANIRITSINSRQVKLTVNDQPMVLGADDALALAHRILAVLGK
jgi:hypothetical protein